MIVLVLVIHSYSNIAYKITFLFAFSSPGQSSNVLAARGRFKGKTNNPVIAPPLSLPFLLCYPGVAFRYPSVAWDPISNSRPSTIDFIALAC